MLHFVTKDNYPGIVAEIEGCNYTPEESRKLIHKLLGDNRKLTKYLKRFKLTSKQHIKLIYVVEAVLFNHMAEEQLVHTNNVTDCLGKVKQYLNITKKFVEKTEVLLQQYDFEGESEREQLVSSVQEMGPITRICSRIQKKVDSKQPKRGPRSNGTLPRKRNGLVSPVVENGEHSGNTRKYRKRKMSSSSNSYRKTSKITRRDSQEESQDEQNEFGSNQQNHRAASRSGLIKQRTKQRRRQKRAAQTETTDNESGRETENKVSTSEEEESISEKEEYVSVNGNASEKTVVGNESAVETEFRLAIPVRDILYDPAADNDPDVSKYKQKFMPKENSSKEDEEAYEVVDESVETPDNDLSDKENQADVHDQASNSAPETGSDEDMADVNTDKLPFDEEKEEEEEEEEEDEDDKAHMDEGNDNESNHSAISYMDPDERSKRTSMGKGGPHTPDGSPPHTIDPEPPGSRSNESELSAVDVFEEVSGRPL